MNNHEQEIVWNSFANLIGVCIFNGPDNNAMNATFNAPFGLKVKCHFEFDIVEDENDD